MTSYWLLKTEPSSYSIDDLAAAPEQTTHWDGVRNYQARNMLRDELQEGDRVLLYHSVKNPAIVGTATVVRSGYPDPSAWDKRSKYYDAKSDPENPRWYMVDVRLDEKFEQPLTLAELREMKKLQEMELLRKGSRLSVQPVRKAEWTAILAKAKAP
ncbi:EVE domain-containing protein [Candidatus Laterigemmans baculatus]|uniref:EVE domain-containing protein n=1 Tax=Candidatus Laterigemmans baculatus TaxID=2770505 RepID=UPI0013DB2E70|nr:EVE domain-containing protein [Candidatus Laterigemmans baculatus]